MRKFLIRSARPVLGLALFSVALFILDRQLHQHTWTEVQGHLQAIPVRGLLLALLLTAASYAGLTLYDVLALRHVGRPLSYPRVALTSFIAFVFSMDLGLSILGGSAIRYRLLSSFGLSMADVGRVITFTTHTFWLGVLGVGGVAFTFEAIPLPQSLGLPVDSTWSIGAVMLGLLALYLPWSATRDAPFRMREFELELPDLPTTFAQLGVAALEWITAATAAWLLLPELSGLSWLGFVAIFIAADVFGLLSTVPAGLGVFEGIMVVLLAPYVPAAAVLGSLLAWRLIYNVLPIFVALALLGGFEGVQRRASLGRAREIAASWGPGLMPRVFGTAVWVVGLLVVAASAVPGQRIEALALKVGLPVIEVSHAVTALVGFALLLLARGLQHRLHSSWVATNAVLAVGLVSSLLRGFHVGLAAALAVLAVSLWLCRGHFDRPGRPLLPRISPQWLVPLGAAGFGSIWFALWANQHEPYVHDMWLRFEASGDLSRALRAGALIAVGGLIALAWRLSRPAQPVQPAVTPDDLERAEAVVAASPSASAHLALLGDKALLFAEDHSAFIMYGVSGGSWVAMGDPVGPPEQREALAWRYRELCDRYAAQTVFYEIGPQDLPVYLDLGLSLHKLGEEGKVPLADFSLEGHAHRGQRQTQRRLSRAGCAFEIVPREAVPSILDEIEAISNAWLLGKKTREKGFSLGAFGRDYIARMPVAIVRQEGRIVAFANLWPGAKGEELSIDLMRYPPDAPPGVMEYLFIELMLWGKAEGYAWFGLGMAPLSGLRAHPLAPAWSRLGTLLFRHGEHFYNFQGLRAYKEKFHPVWEPRYLASPSGTGVPRALIDVASLVSGGIKGVVAR